MTKILDGKKISLKILEQLKEEVSLLKKSGKETGLAVVILGDDPASHLYVGNKEKACKNLGINSYIHRLPGNTSQSELISLIKELNADEKIDGFLIQAPLPPHIDEREVISLIEPSKDVDAFHPVNVGRIMTGDYSMLPCTPAGVMELIAESGISIEGKECVVVGRSNIVGKPQAMLLLHKNGTVTIAHSKTKNLAEVCRKADILVVAVGKIGVVDGSMIKNGAVVIDVGMNRNGEGKFIGDVDFESAAKVASAITPVPGGVGPMTIAMLMKNVVNASKSNLSEK